MPNIIVVGGQWGDEGKGKVVDLLAGGFDIVARWQGGPNAGHTVRMGSRSFAMHQVPTGVLRDNVTGVLGHGMVIDPEGLIEEISKLEAMGVRLRGRLLISNRAHVILPIHRAIDAMAEEAGRAGAVGTTRRGIGPAYAAKAGRVGLRVVDLQDEETIETRVRALLDSGLAALLRERGESPASPREVALLGASYGRALRDYVAETSLWLNERIAAGANVLFEGAQGTMLDLDLGTYP